MDLLYNALPWRVAAASILFAAACLTALPAASQTACMQHQQLVSFLGDRFNEAPHAVGLVANRSMMQVLVSQNGTWTIIMTTTQGLSCILAAGDAWEDMNINLARGTEY